MKVRRILFGVFALLLTSGVFTAVSASASSVDEYAYLSQTLLPLEHR